MKISSFKKVVVLILSFILCSSSTFASSYGDVNGVILDDQKLELDVKPIIKDGRTMVPIRAILEELGMKVSWDNINKIVIGERKEDIIKMSQEDSWLGEGTYNGVPFHSEHAPNIIVNTRTLSPVRTIGNLLGLNVKWDNKNRNVILSSTTKQNVTLKQSYEKLKNYFTFNDSGLRMEYTYLPFGGYTGLDKYVLENYYVFAILSPYEEVNDDGTTSLDYNAYDSNYCVNKSTGDIKIYEPGTGLVDLDYYD